jgi:hypothetical protein
MGVTANETQENELSSTVKKKSRAISVTER